MVHYELQDELASSNKPEDNGPVGYERVIDGCRKFPHIGLLGLLTNSTDPDHVLHPPFKVIHVVDLELQQKITVYVTQVIGGRLSEIMHHLLILTYHAGKVRIQNGGNSFQTAQVCRKSGTMVWRNCYVKVC